MGTSARVVANTLRACYPNGLPKQLAMLDIGAQNCEGALADFEDLAILTRTLRGRTSVNDPLPQALRDQIEDWHHHCLESTTRGLPFSKAILTAMGVRYESIDLTDQATIKVDLNTYKVPALLRNAFDIVGNFGTTEHIFNQSNCFEVIHNLTKIGGHMVHFLPMTGYIFHCLYKYDPKYFLLLARENNYEIVYAGFGTLERGREIDERFATWAQYNEVRTRRYDSHLVEVILRRTTDQPFRPGFDVTGCDLYSKHVFPAPIRSLRDAVSDSEKTLFVAPLVARQGSEALAEDRGGVSGLEAKQPLSGGTYDRRDLIGDASSRELLTELLARARRRVARLTKIG